ncbi:MAG: response regulator transcription factor [Chloroflexi bacterium]|nr:MAG: response regulator transcription factor [Chloroflexota bacterium]
MNNPGSRGATDCGCGTKTAPGRYWRLHVALISAREAGGRKKARPAASAQAEGTGRAITEREVRVLELAAQGLTNKAIAEALAVSTHTVKDHLRVAMKKLGARNRTQAVQTATKRGLI